MSASERGSRLRLVVAFLAIAQGLLGLLRALQLVSLGTDVAERGIVLLPILATLIIARGVLVAVIAALYAMFAWAAFRRHTLARPIGILVALVNVLLVAVVLIGGDSPAGTLLWAVVPAIILVYLLSPAGRRAFST